MLVYVSASIQQSPGQTSTAAFTLSLKERKVDMATIMELRKLLAERNGVPESNVLILGVTRLDS